MPTTPTEAKLPLIADGELTFEAALEKVEQLVRVMENNALSLNETLAAFEEGVRLARFCQEYLDAAEKRIEQVIASAEGHLDLRPLLLEKDEDDV